MRGTAVTRIRRVLVLAFIFSILIPPFVAAPAAASPALTIGFTTMGAGNTPGVSWSGIAAPTTRDWIALVPAASPDTGYVSWQYTNSTTGSGVLNFRIAVTTAPGTYNFRLFANDGWTKLATSSSFTLTSPADSYRPKFSSAAVMPNGNVGLLYANGDNGTNTSAEIRFSRYTSEHAIASSMQLSTAGPAYPQLTTFRGRLVAGYVDTRAGSAGRFTLRVSDDSGATWSAEATPFGTESFDASGFAPRLVASRDAQTLYLFSAASGAIPQYRSSVDPTLSSWSAPSAAGDGSMRVAAGNNCGSAGDECYRAHAFSFVESATVGRWIYVAKSDSGYAQSGRGTQVGVLGGAWSTQVDHQGSGGLSGGGDSSATTFLDRQGFVYFIRASGNGDQLYLRRSTDGGYSWDDRSYAFTTSQPLDQSAAPVGLDVPGYALGE